MSRREAEGIQATHTFMEEERLLAQELKLVEKDMLREEELKLVHTHAFMQRNHRLVKELNDVEQEMQKKTQKKKKKVVRAKWPVESDEDDDGRYEADISSGEHRQSCIMKVINAHFFPARNHRNYNGYSYESTTC